jgi:DNA-binding transcriptional regulator YiaG
MTPQEFKAIRIKMKLTQSEMATWLHLKSSRIIRYWESGQVEVPGSVVKCFELAKMLEIKEK